MDWLTRADAVVQLSVPAFEYPRPDAATRLEFAGMVTTSSALEHPLPTWWSDLDGSRPVVHVTQGTIANDDLSELILPTVHGLADSDVLVVVATGGRPVAELGPLPDNARAAGSCPTPSCSRVPTCSSPTVGTAASSSPWPMASRS